MKCAHREPATPVKNALTQKASSRERMTLMPRDCAAISLSRTATICRPKADLASRQMTYTVTTVQPHTHHSVVYGGTPAKVRAPRVTESQLIENHLDDDQEAHRGHRNVRPGQPHKRQADQEGDDHGDQQPGDQRGGKERHLHTRQPAGQDRAG